MSSLPSISIVVPNYNGGKTLRQTLDSLFAQDYPNLEILVIDGGSTDNSVEIIKEYAPRLAYWESEKDRGQSHALNKGFGKCTGEIVNWLCSDDILLPNTLHRVAEIFRGTGADIVAGHGRYLMPYANHAYAQTPGSGALEVLECRNPIAQPACFFKRKCLDRTPPIDESLHYTMDAELWCYFKSRGYRWEFVPEVWSQAHEDGANKSAVAGPKGTAEWTRIYRRYTKDRIPLTFWYKWMRHPFLLMRKNHPSRLVHYLTWPFLIVGILVLSPFYGMRRVRAMGWV